MLKSVLRLATGSLLMSTALCASAGTTAYEDLSVSGVFQEVLGPSLRCPTKIGGTMTGYGTSPKFGPVVFLGSDCVTPSATMNTFSDGRFILTALTGELLFASYSGQAVPNSDGSQLIFTGGTFQITGGTGTFSFSGQVACQVNGAPTLGTISASGSYSNTVCGTGTADGSASIPGLGTRSFHIQFVAGAGAVFVPSFSPTNIAGAVQLLPTGPDPNACVSVFTVVGGFSVD